MCYAHNTHSGSHQAIGIITAKYIPPTFATEPVGDINLASVCGLSLRAVEGGDGRITISLDFRTLKIPPDIPYTEWQVVAATLECLRRVAGDRLHGLTIETQFNPTGQEAIRQLTIAFKKHPKDKKFF